MIKLQGKKIGMTHVFTEQGKRHVVTVIETEPLADTKPDVELFKPGDFVDVTGISKGKGFQGGMKRWNWSGTPQTHGSMSHRRAGSIGSSATPSRVLKGKHMPGHMGNHKVTIQNLRVIKLDKENALLVIRGAVPGPVNSELIIKQAAKKKEFYAKREAAVKEGTEAKKEAAPKKEPEHKKEAEPKKEPEAKKEAETKKEPQAKKAEPKKDQAAKKETEAKKAAEPKKEKETKEKSK
jgi:ribosomal protein L3